MDKFSDEQKAQIIKKLQERDANKPCPRCGNESFTLLDGYFNQPIQPMQSGIVIGGPSVPSVVVVCQKCGYIAQHALGMLGLLELKGGKQ